MFGNKIKLLDLLDSIVRNYPIGGLLLWNASEKLKYTRNIAGYKIPDNADEYPVNYVLDGQQRILSIYATFSDKTEQDESTDYISLRGFWYYFSEVNS